MSYYDKARDMYTMVGQGKLLDAFEKYYHTDVVMVKLPAKHVRVKRRTLSSR